MSKQTLEAIIRGIVRDEFGALMAARSAGYSSPPVPTPELGEEVDRFLATVTGGERIWAGDLYERWRAWARVEAPGWSPVTATAFGRLAGRSALVERHGLGRRWYARRWAGRGACVGAPDCTEPMEKMSDRCAAHRLGEP
jgi:hypothetical protein